MNLITLKLLICSAFGLGCITAATPLPTWYPGLDVTRQGYIFSSDSLTPAPDIDENPNATATTSITLGQLAAGWQKAGTDPGNFDLNGVDRDGAMDLGKSGLVRSNIEIAPGLPAPGFFYRVEFMVYSVSYLGITSLPVLDTGSLTAQNVQRTQNKVADDPLFSSASWQAVIWTGYFDIDTSTSVTLGVSAPANNTTTLDSYEVFTRTILIPEPTSVMLLTVGFITLISRRIRQ